MSGINAGTVSEEGSNLSSQILSQLRKVINILRFRLSCRPTNFSMKCLESERTALLRITFPCSSYIVFYRKWLMFRMWGWGGGYIVFDVLDRLTQLFKCINRLKVEIDVNVI